MQILIDRFNYFSLLFLVMFSTSISVLSADSWNPKLGIGTLGNAVAVWQNVDSLGQYNIQASFYHSGSGWTTNVSLSLANRPNFDPVIAVDDNDNAVAIWLVVDPVTGFPSLYGSMLIAGKGPNWTTPIQISPLGSFVNGDYQLRINSNKSIVAIWSALDLNTLANNIWGATARIGGSWSSPIQVSN